MGQQILHYPNLRTVIFVEETIKELSATTKTNLYRELKGRVMWQTLNVILDYLYTRNMIAFDKEGKIAWAYNPKVVRKYLRKPHLEWKPE